MVTKEQAMNSYYRQEFHFGECSKTVGPKGGVTNFIEKWRQNGSCKTWKTRPEEFRLPIKYGYSATERCSYITHLNNYTFHLASECPLQEGGETGGGQKN